MGRKVFLDDLPRCKGYDGKRVDWSNCIGYKVEFIYDDIKGEFEILKYKIPNISIRYNERVYVLPTNNLLKVQIKNLLLDDLYDFDKNNTNEKWIDFSMLPLNNGGIDWMGSIGKTLNFKYEDIESSFCIIKYTKEGQILTVLYNGEEFEIRSSNLLKIKLGKITEKITNKFKLNIGRTIVDDKRNITITEQKYIKRHKYYKYKCNKCGFDCGEHYKNGEYREELWAEESNLLVHEVRCPLCCGSPQIVVPEINSIVSSEETLWMVNYFQGDTYEDKYNEAKKYTKRSDRKIYPQCPDCGRIKGKCMRLSDLYNRHSIACICGDGFSVNEKYMYSLLTQLGVEFTTEYSPEWIKPKRYDFYIPSLKLIIEMDGELGHVGGVAHAKSKRKLEDLINDDIYKDEKAKLHGLNVVRIKCEYNKFDIINTNILKELSHLFNMDNIDWSLCIKHSQSNIKKLVCEFKADNQNLTCSEIGDALNLKVDFVRESLKIGNNIGWCIYDPKKEIKKRRKVCNISKNMSHRGRKVEIFKDGISLGVFESCSDLSMQSEKLFGVKLTDTKIGAVALGKRKYHHGFTFQYIEDTHQDKIKSQDI